MRLALAQARAATAHGDVPVGAVLLAPDGEPVAEAHNERELTGDPTAHAELLAIRRAAAALGASRLDGCTLVCTLEPCAMCAGAMVQSRLARLVFAAWDDKAGAAGSVWDALRDPAATHRVEVAAGLLADDSARLLKEFFAQRR